MSVVYQFPLSDNVCCPTIIFVSFHYSFSANFPCLIMQSSLFLYCPFLDSFDFHCQILSVLRQSQLPDNNRCLIIFFIVSTIYIIKQCPLPDIVRYTTTTLVWRSMSVVRHCQFSDNIRYPTTCSGKECHLSDSKACIKNST